MDLKEITCDRKWLSFENEVHLDDLERKSRQAVKIDNKAEDKTKKTPEIRGFDLEYILTEDDEEKKGRTSRNEPDLEITESSFKKKLVNKEFHDFVINFFFENPPLKTTQQTVQLKKRTIKDVNLTELYEFLAQEIRNGNHESLSKENLTDKNSNSDAVTDQKQLIKNILLNRINEIHEHGWEDKPLAFKKFFLTSTLKLLFLQIKEINEVIKENKETNQINFNPNSNKLAKKINTFSSRSDTNGKTSKESKTASNNKTESETNQFVFNLPDDRIFNNAFQKAKLKIFNKKTEDDYNNQYSRLLKRAEYIFNEQQRYILQGKDLPFYLRNPYIDIITFGGKEIEDILSFEQGEILKSILSKIGEKKEYKTQNHASKSIEFSSKTYMRLATGQGKTKLIEILRKTLDNSNNQSNQGKKNETGKSFEITEINLNTQNAVINDLFSYNTNGVNNIIFIDEEFFFSEKMSSFFEQSQDKILEGFKYSNDELINGENKNTFLQQIFLWQLRKKGYFVVISGASESASRLQYEIKKKEFKIDQIEKEIKEERKKISDANKNDEDLELLLNNIAKYKDIPNDYILFNQFLMKPPSGIGEEGLKNKELNKEKLISFLSNLKSEGLSKLSEFLNNKENNKDLCSVENKNKIEKMIEYLERNIDKKDDSNKKESINPKDKKSQSEITKVVVKEDPETLRKISELLEKLNQKIVQKKLEIENKNSKINSGTLEELRKKLDEKIKAKKERENQLENLTIRYKDGLGKIEKAQFEQPESLALNFDINKNSDTSELLKSLIRTAKGDSKSDKSIIQIIIPELEFIQDLPFNNSSRNNIDDKENSNSQLTPLNLSTRNSSKALTVKTNNSSLIIEQSIIQSIANESEFKDYTIIIPAKNKNEENFYFIKNQELKLLDKNDLQEELKSLKADKSNSPQKIITFFDKSNAIGGDYGDLSLNVSKQLYYLPNSENIDDHKLLQFYGRNRSINKEQEITIISDLTNKEFFKKSKQNTKKTDDKRLESLKKADKYIKNLDLEESVKNAMDSAELALEESKKRENEATEAKRQAEEARRKAEEEAKKKEEEERKRVEEEARKQEEAKRQAEEARIREEERKAEEERRKAEEERKRVEEEARKQEEDRRKEEARIKEEEAKRKAEEEAKKKEEEDRRKAEEEARIREEERRKEEERKAEEERKKAEEKEARRKEEARIKEEEARRKEEARIKEEEAKKKSASWEFKDTDPIQINSLKLDRWLCDTKIEQQNQKKPNSNEVKIVSSENVENGIAIENIWMDKGEDRKNKFRIIKNLFESGNVDNQKSEQINHQFEIEENLKDIFIEIIAQAATDCNMNYEEAKKAAIFAKKYGGISNLLNTENNQYKKTVLEELKGVIKTELSQEDFEKMRKFSRKCQDLAQKCGIYSGRQDNYKNVGLRLTFFNLDHIDKLQEKMDKSIQTKQQIEPKPSTEISQEEKSGEYKRKSVSDLIKHFEEISTTKEGNSRS